MKFFSDIRKKLYLVKEVVKEAGECWRCWRRQIFKRMNKNAKDLGKDGLSKPPSQWLYHCGQANAGLIISMSEAKGTRPPLSMGSGGTCTFYSTHEGKP